MLTEQEALRIAKDNVEIAMSVLEELGDSYYADEAHGLLGRALGALVSGLRYFETEDGASGRSGAVDAPGDPGYDPEGGEGAVVPDPLIDSRPLHRLSTDPSSAVGWLFESYHEREGWY